MSALEQVPAGVADADVVAVVGPVRRTVAARLGDRHEVDDVVQETLARLLAARNRLDGSSVLPYAIVTARHLVADHGREGERHRRHAHRVIDLREPDRPDDVVVSAEERDALAAALAELPPADRDLLLAHEVDEEDTATLAERHGSTPGGVAARMARIRARLRVDFLLALRHVELPTARCRPVLVALSAGDQRRQRALNAGQHLLSCSTCAGLSDSLLARRRALAGLLPWLVGGGLLALLRQRKTQVAVSTATAVVAAGAAGAAVVATRHPAATPKPPTATAPPAVRPSAPAASATAPPPAATAARVMVSGHPVAGLGTGATLASYVGQPVQAHGARVLAVPADEGFWLAAGNGRIWVQLRSGGRESPDHIRAGDRLSFTGRVVAHGPGFPQQVGVTAGEGAAELRGQRAHVTVAESALRVDHP